MGKQNGNDPVWWGFPVKTVSEKEALKLQAKKDSVTRAFYRASGGIEVFWNSVLGLSVAPSVKIVRTWEAEAKYRAHYEASLNPPHTPEVYCIAEEKSDAQKTIERIAKTAARESAVRKSAPESIPAKQSKKKK